jgi:hypothetical protein
MVGKWDLDGIKCNQLSREGFLEVKKYSQQIREALVRKWGIIPYTYE